MPVSIPSLPHAAATHEAAMRACLAALRKYRCARRYGWSPPYVALCAAELRHARRAAHATRRTLRIARAMSDIGAFNGTSPVPARSCEMYGHATTLPSGTVHIALSPLSSPFPSQP